MQIEQCKETPTDFLHKTKTRQQNYDAINETFKVI